MRTFLPSAPADALPADWGVRGTARLAFPDTAALAADPVHTGRLRTYLTDMLRPHELALDEAAFARGGQSYGDMAEALIRRAVPPGESVDLLVLAYSVPDITPGRATATWLSHVCPGDPLAFAVTDVSHAAAFTALRLARAYAAGGVLPRALLLVVEQPALPYAPGVPVTLPSAAYGVALLLGPAAPGDLRRPAALGPVEVRAGADAGVPAGPAGGVTAILGPGLAGADRPAGLAGVHRVRTADPGRPATGVWWELAAELEESARTSTGEPQRLVLADRAAAEPGGLSFAVFDVAAERRRVTPALVRRR